MCVIFVIQKTRPTDQMVKDAWARNDQGGGVAWREKKTGNVIWKKGLNQDEMRGMCAALPLPFVAHFRIASANLSKSFELNHPFPVRDDVSVALEGRTKGAVLFHNGTWTEWQRITLETAVRMGKKLPVGKWSDTRAMAFCANAYGPGFLDFLKERSVYFSPTELNITIGDGWKKVNDVWCSNDWFMPVAPHNYAYSTLVCRWGQCKERHDLNPQGYCKLHAMPVRTDLSAFTGESEEVIDRPNPDGWGEDEMHGRVPLPNAVLDTGGTLPRLVKQLGPVPAAETILAEHLRVADAGGTVPPGGGHHDPFFLLAAADQQVQMGSMSRNSWKRLRRQLFGKKGRKEILNGMQARNLIVH